MRKLLLICLLAAPLGLPQNAAASTGQAVRSEVQSLLPGARLRGAATFRLLGLPIYQARLFTKGAAPLDWTQDFAVELTYRRKISRSDLVDATLREMQRLGHTPPPRARLSACYRDVGPGDRYLAVSQGADRLTFLRNGQTTCQLDAPGIKQRFMSIFLGKNTRSARFTRALKGQ